MEVAKFGKKSISFIDRIMKLPNFILFYIFILCRIKFSVNGFLCNLEDDGLNLHLHISCFLIAESNTSTQLKLYKISADNQVDLENFKQSHNRSHAIFVVPSQNVSESDKFFCKDIFSSSICDIPSFPKYSVHYLPRRNNKLLVRLNSDREPNMTISMKYNRIKGYQRMTQNHKEFFYNFDFAPASTYLYFRGVVQTADNLGSYEKEWKSDVIEQPNAVSLSHIDLEQHLSSVSVKCTSLPQNFISKYPWTDKGYPIKYLYSICLSENEPSVCIYNSSCLEHICPNVTFFPLLPNTRYNFSVKRFVVKNNTKLTAPSFSVTKPFRSLPSKPKTPTFPSGWFLLKPVNSGIKITVWWQPLDRHGWHDDWIQYKLIYGTDNQQYSETTADTTLSSKASFPQSSNFTIQLSSVNSQGVSRLGVSHTIDMTSVLHPPVFDVKKVDGLNIIRVNIDNFPEKSRLLSVSVFVCTGLDQQNCKNMRSWSRKIASDERFINFEIQPSKSIDNEIAYFSASVASKNRQSGLAGLRSCVYDGSSGTIQKRPLIRATRNASGIDICFKPLTCENLKARVASYIIEYKNDRGIIQQEIFPYEKCNFYTNICHFAWKHQSAWKHFTEIFVLVELENGSRVAVSEDWLRLNNAIASNSNFKTAPVIGVSIVLFLGILLMCYIMYVRNGKSEHAKSMRDTWETLFKNSDSKKVQDAITSKTKNVPCEAVSMDYERYEYVSGIADVVACDDSLPLETGGGVTIMSDEGAESGLSGPSSGSATASVERFFVKFSPESTGDSGYCNRDDELA